MNEQTWRSAWTRHSWWSFPGGSPLPDTSPFKAFCHFGVLWDPMLHTFICQHIVCQNQHSSENQTTIHPNNNTKSQLLHISIVLCQIRIIVFLAKKILGNKTNSINCDKEYDFTISVKMFFTPQGNRNQHHVYICADQNEYCLSCTHTTTICLASGS
jgi:hypothetical protein